MGQDSERNLFLNNQIYMVLKLLNFHLNNQLSCYKMEKTNGRGRFYDNAKDIIQSMFFHFNIFNRS